MLLFHATAVLGAVALAERGDHSCRESGIAAAFGFVIAAALFAGDLTLRQYAGHGLFPMAAPTGGTLLIASWLALAVAAAWPKARAGPFRIVTLSCGDPWTANPALCALPANQIEPGPTSGMARPAS